VLSSEGTLVRGAIRSSGSKSPYYGLAMGSPESRIRRFDLSRQAGPSVPRRSLLHLVHLADMHVLDPQSPGRYEFMERLYGGPDVLQVVLPAQRPQEFLHFHACDDMIRAINRIQVSPVTNAPPQLLVSGGDNIDNH
jgi:hypothetical protein